MEIVVLTKPVPDSESRLRPNATGTALDTTGLKFVLAGYDESAVEQALLLKEASPGTTVRAIAFGLPARADEALRASLALGVDSATSVEAPPDTPVDPILTARALAHAVARYRPAIVLAGKQASDDEAGLVPSALGEILGMPDFGSVVNLHWLADRNVLTFDRATPDGLESIEVPPPAVLALQQAWNDPRTAKLPMILKSRRAPIDRIPWPDVAAALGEGAIARTRPVGFRLPSARTGAKMISAKSAEEAARELVRILQEEANVFP
ncbi:MAG: electron transfer flavoprotein subunit beta/FixA family protein [Thermoplasmata archaeon]|nr:electron transfer flavoprotein subunit beta/FixA family protein [Thermoplasmata archaeon]